MNDWNCKHCGSPCYEVEMGNSSTGQFSRNICKHCTWEQEIHLYKEACAVLLAVIEEIEQYPDSYNGLSHIVGLARTALEHEAVGRIIKELNKK